MNVKDFFKTKWREIVTATVSVLAVVVVCIVYTFLTNSYIFRESSKHLGEVYTQVSAGFRQNATGKQALIRGWEQYIENSVDILNSDATKEEKDQRRAEFAAFVEEQKKPTNNNITDFYFIREDESDPTGRTIECKSIDGTIITVRTRRSLNDVLNDDTSDGNSGNGVVCRDAADANAPRFMLFAERIADRIDETTNKNKNVFGGFEYAAIGITYSAADMQGTLKIDSFDGKGITHIVLPDGMVLLQSRDDDISEADYFEFLETCSISGKSVASIKEDWCEQKSDTLTIRTPNDEYYMTYMPVGYGDWLIVSLVPSDVVNESMNDFRTLTICVMAAVFICIAVVVAWVLIYIQKRRVREKELEIRSRENLLDLLTVNGTDLFVLFSPDTFRSDYVSPNLSRVLGLDVESVRADVHRIMDASTERHAFFTREGLSRLPEGDTWESDLQMCNVKTHDLLWFKLMLYRATYNGADSFVMMLSDRTKERKMASDLEDAFNIAKSANAAKSNFLANMSHDIRTPMNAILGYATLLAKDAEKPEKVREYIRKIAFSGQHLLSLINDILDMSKIESGKTTLNPEEFNLSEFLEELYSIMNPQANAKKQTFEVHTRGKLPEVVIGDRLRLNQILLNLLSNAVKYTPTGGNIDLTVESADKEIGHHAHLRIEVKDDGVGMSEEFVQHVFDPFAREVTAATKQIQGTGLGMAITKNIVNLMGGTISVQSKLGEGSTFVVELELQVSQNAEPDENFWKAHNVTHILVVDDEEDICVDIKELMEDTGVAVSYALSGRKAIELATQAHNDNADYNIVLLDWKMPEMDGVETARRIRAAIGDDIPIMVLTSYSFEDIEEDAKAAGIDYFMPKPFFVSNFRNAILSIRDKGKASEPTTIGGESIAGLKVLAAEDNEINAEILLELLEIEDVQCEIATNGQEALEKFEKSKPGQYDIIFMDVQMPVMNGYEATRAIRESAHPQAKSIPIIAMTANAFDDDVRQALDAGMDAHLAKPIDMEKLKQLIKRLWKDKQDDKQ